MRLPLLLRCRTNSLLILVCLCVATTCMSAESAENAASTLRMVWGLDFSPDGRYLAAACGTFQQGGPLVVWKVDGWEQQFVCVEEKGVAEVAFSPDGKQLAYATKGEFAAIVDVGSWEEVRRWKAHDARTNSIAYSPDGRMLVTSAGNGAVKVWHVESGEMVNAIDAHRGGTYDVAVSPDGKRLLTGGSDHQTKLWDLTTGEEMQSFESSDLIVRRVRWTRDGRFFLTSRYDGHSRIRDAATGTLAAYVRGGNDCADLTADNRLLATTGWQTEAHVFRVDLRPPDPELSRRIRELIAKFADDDYDLRERVSKQIAEIGMPAAPILREYLDSDDAEFRIRCRRLRTQVISPEPTARLKGHRGDVEVVCFSADGKLLASGCRSGEVKIWDTETFSELQTLGGSGNKAAPRSEAGE